MTILPATGLKSMACACVLTAFTVAGCASGPIDMARAPDSQASMIAEEAALRNAADGLAAHVEAQGWTLTPPAGEAARSFLGRLIGGEGEPAEAGDPVADYIEAASGTRVTSDISELVRATLQVSGDAGAVASAPEGLSRSALERDIAAAETALGAVRRARAFFAEVSARTGTPGDALSEKLSELVEAETALAEAADALAERRWSRRTESLSG
ncbi:hypothetical protein ACWCOP_08560 [Maricaulaceae bacterium MS644]